MAYVAPPQRARPPTARQLYVLWLIADGLASNGYVPTIRELTDRLGCASTNAGGEHVRALRRKGLVALVGAAKQARRIQITVEGWEALNGWESVREKDLPRIVEVETGNSCLACGATTFAPQKPCFMCALIKRERAA